MARVVAVGGVFVVVDATAEQHLVMQHEDPR